MATSVVDRQVFRRADRVAPSRRVRNALWWSAATLAMLLLVAPLAWVLAGVAQRAAANWSWGVFSHTTTGVGGGLSNAIVGTLLLMVGVGILAGITGVGCGIFFAVVAPGRKTTAVLRSASEVLAGIPSIVLGYVGYVALVVGLHWGFSLMAALIVLSVLVVPYVAKSTEIALGRVPTAYTEGGEALGMSRPHILRRIQLRSALPGIATGIILALAISVGETAPLLYTANWSNGFPTAQLTHAPVPYLTYATYTFWDDPYPAVQRLSYDSSAILVFLVLGLILLTRLIVRLTQKYSAERGSTSQGRRRDVRRATATAAQGRTAD